MRAAGPTPKGDSRDGVVASPNHRRVIGITLTMLDKVLCDIESWASGRQQHSVLHQETNNLSDAQRNAILQEVEHARGILSDMRDVLGLTPKVTDASTAIRGACFGLWEPLVELEGKYLSAYGRPSSSLVSYVEPKAKQLLAHLDAIVDEVSESTQ